jgi:hypothetical protein
MYLTVCDEYFMNLNVVTKSNSRAMGDPTFFYGQSVYYVFFKFQIIIMYWSFPISLELFIITIFPLSLQIFGY